MIPGSWLENQKPVRGRSRMMFKNNGHFSKKDN